MKVNRNLSKTNILMKRLSLIPKERNSQKRLMVWPFTHLN